MSEVDVDIIVIVFITIANPIVACEPAIITDFVFIVAIAVRVIAFLLDFVTLNNLQILELRNHLIFATTDLLAVAVKRNAYDIGWIDLYDDLLI